MPPPQPLSGIHPKKKVRFEEPEYNGAVEVDEDVLNQDDEGQQQSLGDASGSSGSPQQFLQDIWLVDWNKQYRECPKWGQAWDAVNDEDKKWPSGYKLLEKRLYFEEKLCIPVKLTEQVINEHHAFLGHIGGSRLQNHVLLIYNFANEREV